MSSAGSTEPFVPELDLRPALAQVLDTGAGYVRSAVAPAFLARLIGEATQHPYRKYREEFGQVRQQIEGFDLFAPFGGSPVMATLCQLLGATVRSHGEGILGLKTWTINEAGVVSYQPGSIGITPHLDGKRYRRLVIVMTLSGRAEFSHCSDRGGTILETWLPEPGSLILLRGPGLDHDRDGRPFHQVGTPMSCGRLAVGLRMSVPKRG